MGDGNAALQNAREAAGKYAWAEAYEAFTQADRLTPLGPSDLDLMASSAWWLGKMRECIALRERAHTGFLDTADRRGAGRTAVDLAEHHSDLNEGSLSAAWLGRAAKLLEDEPEGPEHARYNLTLALAARDGGDPAKVVAFAETAAEIAGRHGDKDTFALATALQGTFHALTGDPERGMPMLEEATVGAVSGELGPMATGWIYCMMITVCAQLADWPKAGQWTEAAKRWCDRQAINGFPGVCRVHRAEIMRLRGALSEAEEEARMATVELGAFNLQFAALAFRELGDIRLGMGDLAGAEEAFRQAHEMGVSPQPGLAVAQLLRGKPQAALNSLTRALSEEHSPMERLKLLPAQLEAAHQLGDNDTARAAAAELTDVASRSSSPAIEAIAQAATARVALADRDYRPAEVSAKTARRLFKETDLIHEAARVSLVLGEIYQAEGDPEAAEFEIRSALSTFEKIGALPDADRARALLQSLAAPVSPDGKRVAKTFFFSDIVKSTNLLEAIGDDAWTDLLKWHDETLRGLFAEHGGEEVVHTGDGFCVAFPTADAAVACAIGIQRSLAGHRRAHGFSPQVRIGLHAAEATELKGNYHGRGVHEAARIGALAEGGEILVSASTLDCVEAPVATTDDREVSLKGVAGPMRIASVTWRSD